MESTPSPSPAQAGPAAKSEESATDGKPAKPEKRQVAQQLALDFIAALGHRDLDSLMGLSSVPFGWTGFGILNSKDELKQRFSAILSVPFLSSTSVDNVYVMTIAEVNKKIGAPDEFLKLEKNLLLGDDDLAVAVYGVPEGVIFIRSEGDRLTIGGSLLRY
ncbi:hypothetical protein [Burkholderia ubonensis]|uniref:hypothetical protein n=1 Tax=Burkholderia ubonensis TaxID=101571 RepID=UPI0012FA02F7|nr:hypothetical protein [Burkholderia ubonensis]